MIRSLLLSPLLLFQRTVWRYVTHPDEFYALLQFKFMHAVPGVPADQTPAQLYCYEKLQQVHFSRSPLAPPPSSSIPGLSLLLRGHPRPSSQAP